MNPTLYVGDIHARPEDLDDSQHALDLVLSTAQQHKVERIVFLGDQFHTHAIVHLEVLAFWKHNVKILTAAGFDLVFIVGNHDMSGDSSSTSHAMMAYESMPKVTVVDKPTQSTFDKLTYLPYMADNEKFIEACQKVPDHVIVCHQDFNGGQYDNGFFSSSGVDPECIPQTLVLSGHIHTAQRFGSIWYLGSPRWLTASDANQDRFIYVISHSSTGHVGKVIPIPTDTHCRRICQVEDTPEAPYEKELNPKHKYIVDIIGPQTWINERRLLWQGKARIRSQRTDQQVIKLKESEGIELALVKFAQEFLPTNGTPTDVLMSMVKTRLLQSQ